jgi:hypothetical protein
MGSELRGFPPLTDVTFDVGRALLTADGPVTVVELVGSTGRSSGSVRRVLADMECRNWAVRCVGRREGVPPGAHLWAYTEAGRAQAEFTFGPGTHADGPGEGTAR